MATTSTPTSELEAVNVMLQTIGESPVSSLEISGLADVAIAKQVLSEVSREVQSSGWHFNSEYDYPLAPSVDGYLLPPTNTMRVDTTKEYNHFDVTMRGTRLYDRENRTYVFTDTLKVNLILLLDFSELPEAARYYITLRAARKFQKRVLGSETLDAYTKEDEFAALVTLKEAEGDTGDYNMLNGSYSVAMILDR